MNKTVDLENILVEHEPFVVIITETWLVPSTFDCEIVPPGYYIIRKDRLGRGGGVAIIIKNCINYVEIEDSPDIESVWCSLKPSKSELIISAVYRPPGTSLDFAQSLNDFLIKLHVDSKKVIITGDFNVGEVDWNASLPGTRDVLLSSALIDTYFLHGLTQVVKEFSRIQGNSRSILDLFF